MRAASGKQERDLPADAATTANDQRDLPAELALRRHALQLRLLERPVLDAERLGSWQRDVIVKALEFLLRPPRLRQRERSVCRNRGGTIAPVALRTLGSNRIEPGLALFERRRAGHHMDGVDEELRGDPRFTFVSAEAEHTERRNHDDRRVRIPQGGGVSLRAGCVVRRIRFTITADPFDEPLLKPGGVFTLGIPGYEHRADPGPQEMVRTTRAHPAEVGSPE